MRSARPAAALATVIVVPCYNEAARLDVASFRAFARRAAHVHFILVDDGSTDRTLEVLRQLEAADPHAFSVLPLSPNRGKAEAVRQGVRSAFERRPELVGFWDADLATPLDLLPAFARILAKRPRIEAVLGSRVRLLGRRIERKAWRHYIGRAFATAVSFLLRVPVYDTQCGAKLFRVTPDLAATFDVPFRSRWIFDVELLARFDRLRRAASGSALESVVYELPLPEWRDVPGSKLRLRDVFGVGLDLVSLYWDTRRRSAPIVSRSAAGSPLLPPAGNALRPYPRNAPPTL